MNHTFSFSVNNIVRLLFQDALQTRELSQKKNEINAEIKVYRVDTAERKAYIEKTQRNVKKLEEEIRVKQSTVTHNKANAKSMKAVNGLLLQYEHTLTAELESRKISYKHEMEVQEERISSYSKIFQSHEEYYCQNPLAQMLLMLQAEKEEIECRIKACDYQVTMKQKELQRLASLAVVSSSTEKLPDSVSGHQHVAEPEKPLDPQEESYSAIDISSLHLNQTENRQETFVEADGEEIPEENKVQYTTVCSPSPGEECNELLSCHSLDEQRRPEEMHTDEQETGQEDQVLVLSARGQQSTVSDVEQAGEEEVKEKVALDEEQVTSDKDEGLAAFPQSSSQETDPQSSPAEMTVVPSTPTFTFNFCPGSSPRQSTSDTKSPAFPGFLFSMNSGPSTPEFSGFNVGSPQDGESSFAFTGSFFNDKKTTESKSSTCPEFLFGQPEQTEDFQFPFAFKSPQTSNKDNTKDDFPFSFNF